MELEQLPDRVTHAVEGLPDRVTSVVGGLRDRAAGAVASDGSSVFREFANVQRRMDRGEERLGERIEAIEASLGSQLASLAATGKRTTWPRKLFWLLTGAGIGAVAAYLADPDRGRARRTQLTDQAGARARDVAEDLKTQAKIKVDRTRGQIVEGVKDALPETPTDDPALLEQRIKSEVFGRRDDVQDVVLKIDGPGSVAVKGTVDTADAQRELIAEIAEVDGVIDVRSELSVRSA